MNTSPSAIVWLVGWAFYLFGIYTRHARRFRQQTVLQQKTQPLDVILDMLTFVGWQIMPLIWIFAGWFDFADYSLPIGLGFVGTAGFVLALFLLWKAYAALGDNWSPKMDVRENQQLVTEGPFAHIRHPISFIQHNKPDMLKRKCFAMIKINESPRCSDYNLGSILNLSETDGSTRTRRLSARIIDLIMMASLHIATDECFTAVPPPCDEQCFASPLHRLLPSAAGGQ